MAQKTVVVKLPPERGRELSARLEHGPFEFRGVPHARFSARGEGVVATLYDSGKLVVQGEDPDGFLARHLGAAVPAHAASGGAGGTGAVETTVGSDESGKGDYFGPLIVAGARLDPDALRALEGGNVRDSKTLSDEACLRLGAALRGRFPHAIARLDPPEYNAEHGRVKNLNPILAHLHGQVIRELASPGMLVVVDQFAKASLVEREVEGLNVRLVQRPRGEEILAVAAASVIAREQFLLALARLSLEFAVDLHKGAGEPADRAAHRFVAVHGVDKLGQVAKLHFKTTQKLGLKR